MYVSEKHKFVYVAIPKTASRAVGTHLVKHYDAEIQNSHHGIEGNPSVYRGKTVFVTTRNPYSRAVSMWAYYTKEMTQGFGDEWRTFDEFVKRPLLGNTWTMSQSQWIGEIPATVLTLKMEFLRGAMASLPFTASPQRGVYSPAIQQTNTGDYGKWQDHYTEEAQIRVSTLFHRDFAELGYGKRIL